MPWLSLTVGAIGSVALRRSLYQVCRGNQNDCVSELWLGACGVRCSVTPPVTGGVTFQEHKVYMARKPQN